MKRRGFIRNAIQGSLGSAAALSLPTARVFAAPEDYTGRFFVTLQADGAWDVSSFCDPKINQTGSPEINVWSRTQDIESAGNIAFAPVANNAAFFQKYYQDMLVINGIDAQTNSHSTGVLHNWSGKNSAGYPSLTALFAANNAPDLPLAYLNYGGYAETARLIRYTRLDDIRALLGVLTPNVVTWDRNLRYRDDNMLNIVKQRQQERLARLRADQSALPRQSYAMDTYAQARSNASGLTDFANVIPPDSELQQRETITNQVSSTLRAQIQVTLLALQSGSACSADLHVRGFDTHTDHDNQHFPILAHLTDAIDYFWTTAEAQGIADRITLLIASDFARTPFYNASNGKDHWPIGSAIVMERNASWGNRVVGSTDEGQNANELNGTLIYPRHLHKALRDYLGIGLSPLASPFPFDNTEDLPFFI